MWRSLIWEQICSACPQGALKTAAGGEGEPLCLRHEVLLERSRGWAAVLSAELKKDVLQRAEEGQQPPIVALHIAQSVDYVAAVLAVLAAGAAFMPLDPSWPRQRLLMLVRSARPALLITSAAHAPGGALAAPPGACRALLLEDLMAQAAQPGAAGLHDSNSSAEAPAATPLPFCYVLATSGSTGLPLLVCGTEQGILNRCQWMQRTRPLVPGDCVAFKTPISFVDHIWEVFGPLLAAADTLVVPQPLQLLTRPAALLGALGACAVTHMVAVPSVLQLLAQHLEQQQQQQQQGGSSQTAAARWPASADTHDPLSSSSSSAAPPVAAALRHLKVVVSSGEPLTCQLAGRLVRLLPPSCDLLNICGCTEVSADVTCLDVREHFRRCPSSSSSSSSDAEMVPVGWPIHGAVVAVVDPGSLERTCGAGGVDGPVQLVTVPRGSVGELCVSGQVLAAGYLLASQATSTSVGPGQRFIKEATLDAISSSSVLCGEGCEPRQCKRWFMTGDLGRVLDDGGLAITGRADLQVKVAGARVDLQEVEALVGRHHRVAEAAVAAWQPAGGPGGGGGGGSGSGSGGGSVALQLVAYVVLQQLAGAGVQEDEQGRDGEELRPDAELAALLRPWLQQALPPAALPSHFVRLPRLPRTPAGKLLRSALPRPPWLTTDTASATTQPLAQWQQQYSAAVALTEGAAVQLFRAALHHDQLEPADNIFLHGATSLTAATIAAQAGIDPTQLYAHPSARLLVKALSGGQGGGDGALQTEAPPHQATEPPAVAAITIAPAAWADPWGPDSTHEERSDEEEGKKEKCDGSSKRRRLQALEPQRRLWSILRHADAVAIATSGDRHSLLADLACTLGPLQNEALPVLPLRALPIDAAGGAGSVLLWRRRMGRCIDAAPVVLTLLQRHGACDGAPAEKLLPVGGFVVAASHDGDVACVSAVDGSISWLRRLGTRIEAGLAVTPDALHVCIAGGDDCLHLLALDSGQPAAAKFPVGGGIKAAPVLDPWWGLAWLATHGASNQLVAVSLPAGATGADAHGEMRAAASYAAGAPASASVAFHAAIRTVFLACLDGSVHALLAEKLGQPAAAATTCPQQPQGSSSGSALQLTVAWVSRAVAAPVFSAPAVDAATDRLLVAHVDGTVRALEVRKGGAVAWQQRVAGHIFADVSLMQPCAGGPAGAGTVALVPTHAGCVHAFSFRTGSALWVLSLPGQRRISNAAFGLSFDHASSSSALQAASSVVVVATNCGALAVFQLPQRQEQLHAHAARPLPANQRVNTPRLLALVQLPGEVFSSPVVAPQLGCVVLGCRDDHLYALDMQQLLLHSASG